MAIPKNELWLHRPKARRDLVRALDWARRNPPSETEPEVVLRELERRPDSTRRDDEV